MKRNILLLSSIVIFACIDLKSLIVILIGSLYGYLLHKTKLISKKYGLLSVIPFVLLLLLTKVPDSFISIFGYSYLSLKIISFLIDSRSDKIAEADLKDYLLYIFYLPSVFVGPIFRFNDFIDSLKNEDVTKDNIKEGIYRISLGLIKKIVVANRLSLIITNTVKNEYEGLYVLIVMLIYVIYLYMDFSGGIDIVNGISLFIGYRFKENFNRPLSSKTVKEFWGRWHISLSSFLRDYIYIPLGGKKKHKAVNVLITFLVSGLWHGFNYVIWGLINGILVILNFRPKNDLLAIVLNYLLVSVSFIFFIYTDIPLALSRFISIFSVHEFEFSLLSAGLRILEIILVIVMTVLIFILENNNYQSLYKMDNSKFILVYGLLAIFLLVFGKYGIGFDGGAFVYSRF